MDISTKITYADRAKMNELLGEIEKNDLNTYLGTLEERTDIGSWLMSFDVIVHSELIKKDESGKLMEFFGNYGEILIKSNETALSSSNYFNRLAFVTERFKSLLKDKKLALDKDKHIFIYFFNQRYNLFSIMTYSDFAKMRGDISPVTEEDILQAEENNVFPLLMMCIPEDKINEINFVDLCVALNSKFPSIISKLYDVLANNGFYTDTHNRLQEKLNSSEKKEKPKMGMWSKIVLILLILALIVVIIYKFGPLLFSSKASELPPPIRRY